ncbi:uncharacterized protein LOC110974909 [Acanthaster planci]|uniref:Uncharacterized protein LOC110974909 n=1 Tax=Acanthaster planci TaxID=133434 RepID=A0A8B7XP19_ACAPL|nr:uncharacterized protein LOC110974909 [Acanthaster planci]
MFQWLSGIFQRGQPWRRRVCYSVMSKDVIVLSGLGSHGSHHSHSCVPTSGNASLKARNQNYTTVNSLHLTGLHSKHHKNCLHVHVCGLSYHIAKCSSIWASVHVPVLRWVQKSVNCRKPTFTCHKRCHASKAAKRGKGSKQQSEDTDSDEDIIERDEDDLERDWDPEIDGKLEDSGEEAGNSKEWKEIQQFVPSLRLDAVLSAGLGVSRKKIEEAYLGARLRINEEKVAKKSKQVKEGDILDMILERSSPSAAKAGDTNSDGLTVMRLHVMEIATDRTGRDRIPVLLRRWKNLKIAKEK